MKRNITLDYTKLILSFLVIAIHNPILKDFPFFSNLISNGLSRIAVPCFFVINGLYLEKVLTNKTTFKKYIKKLFGFYFVWMLIYSPFYLFHFKDTLEKSIFLNFNTLVFGYWHLWYIMGLLGGVVLLYYFKNNTILEDRKLLSLSISLFIIGWGLQQFRLFYPDSPGILGSLFRANFYSRNFAFMAFPLITIGYLISKDDFMIRIKKRLTSSYLLFFLFVILAAEVVLHFFMIGTVGFDFYFILIILCPALIILILKKSRISEVESDYISKLSAVIYFIHPLILFLLKDAFPKMHGTRMYVLIVFFSFLLGSALIDANKRLKIFF